MSRCMVIIFGFIIFSSMVSVSFAQLYVTSITTPALVGEYLGTCKSIGIGLSTYVSILDGAFLSNTSFVARVFFTVSSSPVCSLQSPSGLIIQKGTYTLNGPDSGVPNAYDMDVTFTEKTLTFNNPLVADLLATLVNSNNQTCFPNVESYQANTTINLVNISCSTLFLYPCSPLLAIIKLALGDSGIENATPVNGTAIYVGPGTCTTRATAVNLPLFSAAATVIQTPNNTNSSSPRFASPTSSISPSSRTGNSMSEQSEQSVEGSSENHSQGTTTTGSGSAESQGTTTGGEQGTTTFGFITGTGDKLMSWMRFVG